MICCSPYFHPVCQKYVFKETKTQELGDNLAMFNSGKDSHISIPNLELFGVSVFLGIEVIAEEMQMTQGHWFAYIFEAQYYMR